MPRPAVMDAAFFLDDHAQGNAYPSFRADAARARDAADREAVIDKMLGELCLPMTT